MNLPRDSNGVPITWQFMLVVGAIVGAVSGGAIWLGAIGNQVAVNSSRLTRIEDFMNDVRQHDANTTARLAPIEQRLDRLEGRDRVGPGGR